MRGSFIKAAGIVDDEAESSVKLTAYRARDGYLIEDIVTPDQKTLALLKLRSRISRLSILKLNMTFLRPNGNIRQATG